MLHEKKTPQELDVDVRFLLANERTLLAWIRTGLAIIAGGVAVSYVSTHSMLGMITGIGTIVFGGLLCLVGYSRYRSADKAIRKGELPSTNKGEMLVVVGVITFAAALIAMRSLYNA